MGCCYIYCWVEFSALLICYCNCYFYWIVSQNLQFVDTSFRTTNPSCCHNIIIVILSYAHSFDAAYFYSDFVNIAISCIDCFTTTSIQHADQSIDQYLIFSLCSSFVVAIISPSLLSFILIESIIDLLDLYLCDCIQH